MQVLIKERAKDQVINVRQRASLYQTIHRLEREGLIVPKSTPGMKNGRNALSTRSRRVAARLY
jgi:DNA-binding PadR family transcriptional regulator